MKTLASILSNVKPIKSYIAYILIMDILLVGLIYLDNYGFEVTIFRATLAFILLTFIPGFIVLHILKITKLNFIECILYSVGLSLSFLMIVGLILNSLYFISAIQKPISTVPLIIALIALNFVLCIMWYMQGNDFHYSIYLDHGKIFSPKTLSLLLIPFLSIIGTYMMNVYSSNVLLLVILFILSLLPILILFNKLSIELLPLTIFITSISLLFSYNLISGHLWGWDIHFEYYFANLVLENSYWQYNLPYSVNGLLLITILAPVYSTLTGLELIWVLKIFFPLFFSLVPLGIYHVCKDQFKNDYIQIFAPFLFIFYYGFFKDMPDKQHISELFLILLVMLILDKKISTNVKKIMALLLSFSLIVSHYGVSFIFLFSLIFMILFLKVTRNTSKSNDIVNVKFTFLYAVLVIGWYSFVSGGTTIDNILNIGDNFRQNLSEIFEMIHHRSGMSYATLQMPTFIWELYKYINLLLQVFIVIGIGKLVFSIVKKEKNNCSIFFYGFVIFFYLILIIQMIFTIGLGMDRILQIALLFLAPFAAIGCNYSLELIKINPLKKLFATSIRFNVVALILGVFLSIFLLFNSGFIFEVTKDPYPLLFNLNKSTAYPIFTEKEVNGALWLKNHAENNRIFTEGDKLKSRNDGLLLSEYFLYENQKEFNFDVNTTNIPPPAYIYLGRLGSEKGKIYTKRTFGFNKESVNMNETKFYNKFLINVNKVYDNGGSNTYKY